MDLMPRRGDRPGPGAAGDPAADQGLSAARRLVGEGAFVDRAFNTIDVCVVMDTARMTERYLRSTSATGGGGVRAGWNGAEPPALPPLTTGERLRLCCARPGRSLPRVLFAVSCRSRASTCFLARLAGRSVTRLGPRRAALGGAGAADAGPRFVRRGGRCARAGPSSPTTRAGSTSWRCSGRRRRSWSPRRRCATGRGSALSDARSDHVHRPAPGRGEAAGGGASRAACRGDRMAIFPEGTSTDGQRVLPFKSALFGVFFAPELAGRVRCSR